MSKNPANYLTQDHTSEILRGLRLHTELLQLHSDTLEKYGEGIEEHSKKLDVIIKRLIGISDIQFQHGIILQELQTQTAELGDIEKRLSYVEKTLSKQKSLSV